MMPLRCITVRSRPAWNWALAVALLIGLVACGDEGPQRYRLAGEVTLDGQPVPEGWVVFAPEKGPGASADIKNGRYETPPGFGSIGGKHTIEVVAFKSGNQKTSTDEEGYGGGGLWFRHKLEADLPAKATTWDIHISTSDLAEPPGG